MILRNSRQRSGWTLIYALVVLAVLTAFMAVAVQNSVQSRRALHRRADQLQALWLARAGVEVALERHQKDPNYSGEVLELITGSRVTVKVSKSDDGSFTINSDASFSGLSDAPAKSSVSVQRK